MSAQAEAGNIKLVRGRWNDPFLDELENFPEGAHNDIVDSLSGAFNEATRYVPFELPPPTMDRYTMAILGRANRETMDG